MRPAPHPSITRLLNIKPVPCATRRSTVQMSTTHFSNRERAMNFSDLLKGKGNNVGGSEAVANAVNINASRMCWRALPLSIALTLLCAASTKAQSPALPDQTVTQTADETKGKTTGNYTIQQSIE